MPESPSDKSLRGRAAAYERWARTADRTAATEPARAGLNAKFAAAVDPDGTLSPGELARRVEAKRKAHFARLSLLSAQRRRRIQAARAAEIEDQAVTDACRTAADEIEAAF
ncbi:MAG TPA: hypothetical protein VN840_00400 [Streptosporangiaceae bacterium]|nr:hypothetical protein [Streptosporangiaceae bacterium]